ncbi:MAG: MBOAT family protein [Myxococcota bacterium]|nr:MBOAT family protein [Myxococcota bacterium]
MVFSSPTFLFLFLPAALLLYALTRRVSRTLSHLVLIGMSTLFYGWANPLFVPLLFLSAAVDYGCGLFIARAQPGAGPPDEGGPQLCPPDAPRTRSQRVAVATSVVVNLGVLGFFKYGGFFASSVASVSAALGLGSAGEDVLRITLPLGISFYTFQSMSYTIDVYRGHARATTSAVDFACYVSLFPQLVAGPIVRFSEVADQLRERTHDAVRFARGVAFFSVGLAKKVLIANPVGALADLCFEAGTLDVVSAWIGVFAYSFQIYFDFSGYSDMAIGLGLMLGFVFPKNFDSPYRSASITEFWRRWHISLSSFLRDYLYLPLGGNREGRRRTAANLMIVMGLGGLWHGASWNFVIWGLAHGLLLAAERAYGRRALWQGLPQGARVALSFIVVSLLWVPFRAADLPAALSFYAALFGLSEVAPAASLVRAVLLRPDALAILAVAGLVVWRAPQTWDWTRRLSLPRVLVALALLAVASGTLLTQQFNPFIYFIF